MAEAQKGKNTTEKPVVAPRVIAISSGKGGVGKTSIAVNVGISLAKAGYRVCLLDADTGLANVNILLGITPQYSIEHVLYGAKSIEEVIVEGPFGLKVIPGANGISECVSLHPRQQMRLIEELAHIESDFDFFLIDTAAGITQTTLDFICAAHHGLLVITPEPTSLTDAFSLLKLLRRKRKTMQYHVVVNMANSASQARAVFHRFANAVQKYIRIQLYFLDYIPKDESLRAAVTLQNPVSTFSDSDPSSRRFIRLADALAGATKKTVISYTFSTYWRHQYHQMRQKLLAESNDQVPKETSYNSSPVCLSTLQSQLLSLVETKQVDADQLQGCIQALIDAFSKQFDALPVDIVSLVEQILTSSNRDDHRLREIYNKVRPWGHSELAMTAGKRLPVDYAAQEGSMALESLYNGSVSISRSDPPYLDKKSRLPLEEAFQRDNRQHRYNSVLFGSQEALVKHLQTTDDTHVPIMDMLSTVID